MAKIGSKSESSYTNPDAVDDEPLSETEITLGEYTFTISSVNIPPPLLTKNENQMPVNETNIKTYRCNECGTIFPNRKKLCYHRRTHDGPFVCDICGKSLSRKFCLKLHMLNHVGRSKSYSCDICGVEIPRKNYLKSHMAIHLNKFPCDECGKSYRHRSSLDAHKAMHSGTVNPFTCDKCGRSVTSKLAFQRHMRLHSEKNYVCDLCDMKFSQNASLYYHKKKHDDGSLLFFSCGRCGLKFTQKSKLRAHYLIHRGSVKKPFICGECGASFVRKLYLNRHMAKHTQPKTPNAPDKESHSLTDADVSTVPEITDIKSEIEVGEYECVSQETFHW